MDTKLSEEEVWGLVQLACQGEHWATTKLVEEYAGLVKRVVRSFAKKGVLNFVESDDLMQDGFLGLLDAIASNYEMRKESTFGTYAVWRIKGAIVDGIRRDSPVSKEKFHAAREAEKVRVRLSHTLLREPTLLEWENALPEELREKFQEIRMTEILKSGSVSSTGDSDEGLDDFIFPPANGGSSVEDEFIALEERELIRKAVSKILKGREKDIITLRYLGEGLTQLELGELFGVDKSHIAHTEKRALTKLREHLCT